MTDKSKSGELHTIERVFDLLDGWRHLAGYQLERRADIFFALFLPEVLEEHCGVKIRRPLIPEFPVYSNPDNKRHNQVDFFVLSESEDSPAGVLVELKTDMASIDENQCDALRDVASNGLQHLIKYVISLAQNQNKPRRNKYVHLLAHLRELNLVEFDTTLYKKAFAKNSTGITEMLLKVEPTEQVCKDNIRLEVICVLPRQRSSGSSNIDVIDFEEFATTITSIDKSETDGIRRVFAHYLREWAAHDAGSRNPKDWDPS